MKYSIITNIQKHKSMTKSSIKQVSAPAIVKLTEAANIGIRPTMLSRMAIGYLQTGRKYIYDGDCGYEIGEGDMFIYDIGLHFEENITGAGGLFEQIMFYISPDILQQTLFALGANYGIGYAARHSCERCRNSSFASMRATQPLRDFFAGINQSFRHEGFRHNDVAQSIKLNELIYLLISEEEGCLRSKMLLNADTANSQFASVIHDNIYNDVGIEALARMTNRSLTSFKKEFKRLFAAPPHKWFIEQRLHKSKMLLISTSKTISEVGAECAFSNISHFIKLFKNKFNDTPAVYRQKYQTAFNPAEPSGRAGNKVTA